MGRNLLNEIAGYAPGGLEPAMEPAVRQADSKLHLQQMLSLQLRPILWDNLILVIIVVVYIAAIYGVHAAYGIRDRIVLLFFSESFTRMAIIFTGLFFLYHIWKKSYRQLITPRSLIGFLTVFALMPVFKSAFASYKQTIPLVNPFSWDYSLMRLDHFLHFGNHPWRLLEPIVQSPLLVRAADYVYMSWFYLLFLSCLWMGWTPRRHLRLCYLVSTLLVWGIIGSVFATFLSSAGPCFYSKVVSAEEDPYAPLMQKLSEISNSTPGEYLHATFNQAGLWEGKKAGVWGPFGGISAMPSIHLAMATLFAWLAFSVRKWLGWIFVGYVVLIFMGSIVLGWHYAVDGYAGVILASLIWLAVRKIVCRSAGRSGPCDSILPQ
jgi:membrane-associated phospholipid phosphatase